MEIRPIHTDADYRAVLREVSAYFENEPEPGTPEGDRFEVLVTLVEAYEAKHFPIDLPDPVEAIKFRMEQAGLAPKDLVPAIGRLNRVYDGDFDMKIDSKPKEFTIVHIEIPMVKREG